MSVEIFRHGIRVSAMFPDAQGQGLQPLNGLEGVEGTDCGSQVPQQSDPCLDNISDWAQGLDSLSPDGTMIAGIGLVQQGLAVRMGFPIEIPAINN